MVYHREQLVTSLNVQIKEGEEDIHGIDLMIDKSFEDKLAKSLIDYALNLISEAESAIELPFPKGRGFLVHRQQRLKDV
jgi:hypothetical protein